jgi:hypothetical protein
MDKTKYKLLELKNVRELQMKELRNFKNAEIYLETAFTAYKRTKDADAFLHVIHDVAAAQAKWHEIIERTRIHPK